MGGFTFPQMVNKYGLKSRSDFIFHQQLLSDQLPNNGNGDYAYMENLDEAIRLFVAELTSTLEVIALDAKVHIDFNPQAVAYYRPIGYENRDVADQDFRDEAVDASEIGAGHSATASFNYTQANPGSRDFSLATGPLCLPAIVSAVG